ncbi:50S ribosomal protein L22 [Marinilabilia salmonicolor]|jgi:large subunit ribosomal protein L22|uniref:Large ribosomal subunit protein uL22 n=1 Tax=Marinilabilia salmonicolor TaxID=989 RepID=A0A2T0XTI7_9BACT|nr:50S ribosomal protein L22 [Marinilabilia salmonicolor]PRZ02206.1 LSU ribosomal protein L22P [Marinilabilia salmonicolor]RCW36161.1 LSU ribosomal protein L22P [Marinilabilia salmonicolor]
MGARKRIRAEKIKEARKQEYVARLRNVPTSPRKMRLVADMVRGMEVNKALDVLKFSTKEASRRVEKLLLSAIANWKEKNEDVRLEDANLYVKEIYVDSGRILKRLRPAPQGRAHRIRKRSNHVTIKVDSKVENQEN